MLHCRISHNAGGLLAHRRLLDEASFFSIPLRSRSRALCIIPLHLWPFLALHFHRVNHLLLVSPPCHIIMGRSLYPVLSGYAGGLRPHSGVILPPGRDRGRDDTLDRLEPRVKRGGHAEKDTHTHICTCIQTYIHTHTHTYIHTYTHIYKHTYHHDIHTITTCIKSQHTYHHNIHTITAYIHAYVRTYVQRKSGRQQEPKGPVRSRNTYPHESPGGGKKGERISADTPS